MASSIGLSPDEMAALQAVSEATNKFAISLFRALSKKKEEGNVFVSPLTAQIVLALAYTGAKGKTAEELATLLSLPEKIEDTYAGYNSLIKVLQDPVLNLATRMFVEASSGVKEEFQKNAEKYFSSTAESLNFTGDHENARVHINTWVEEQTKKKIRDLLAPNIIGPDTRLVLVNAIHFKANWNLKFDDSETRPRQFHVSKSKSFDVLMMNTKKKFGFTHDEELKSKILELVYEGRIFRMLVFLPDDIEGLAELEAKLETTKLAEKVRYLHQSTVTVSLPKFRLEETMDLNETLKSLGAQTMFTGNADFSGLSAEPLVVSNVVQKAFVEVNEEGTEAAAATAMGFSTKCAAVFSLLPSEFIADHPFIFMILSKKTTLFVGKVAVPPSVAD